MMPDLDFLKTATQLLTAGAELLYRIGDPDTLPPNDARAGANQV